MTLAIGGSTGVLATEDVKSFIQAVLEQVPLEGRSLCVIVPDSTRSCPLPLLLKEIHDAVAGRVSRLTILVALGTHPPMTPAQLATHLGDLPDATIVNHEWWIPEALVTLGELSADEVAAASEGRLRERVAVRINRHVVEHDIALVVGPVFPHEVVGFSGGNKYFFPGVSGKELIDLSHWVGALITSSAIIGTPGITPVRALIDKAVSLIPTERLCLACVVPSGTYDLHALSFGTPEDAWRVAAEVSAQTHVRYLSAPVRRVLSCVSTRYDEIWTAAKGMYKVEPVVADGGEVVLFAPHVKQVSETHGASIAQIGYHCRDYFLGQPERFADIPRGVLAHSTHLRGPGTWSSSEGEAEGVGEHCRINVTLATGIPEAETRALGLGYLDPSTIDPDQWALDPDTLVVPDAGEILFRL